MKKFTLLFFVLIFLFQFSKSQVPKEIILNTTGYGFSSNPTSAPHYNSQWDYIQKFVNLTYNGQDASVTAVRFYINWEAYEPTLGVYKRAELVQAIQDIVSLKGGTMKIALHFPYSRPGLWNDSYFADSSVARIYNGTYVRNDVSITCPSIYSEYARNRYYAFVNDALAQLSSFYNKILFVEAGCTSAEEFSMPWLNIDGYTYPGMHDDNAARAWRTEYLPCRYPGQSTVMWDGNTHTIANAPLAAQGQWPSWNTDHGKEFHRFASWGLMRFYKGFRDAVKSHNTNLKVIYFVSDFGSPQGNSTHLHNASLPMAMNELDGVYTSEADLDNIQEKIMALDVLKGTNPNKLAMVEFDPTDLGQGYAGPEHILPGVAETWIPRAYKHGADYVLLAMHYHDPAISTLTPALAMIRANYVNGTYQSPSRQTFVNVNTAPTVFQGGHLFIGTWKDQLGGNNWTVTDNNPVSVNMTDNNYWENTWSCTSSNPCDFNITASANPSSVPVSGAVALSYSCSGSSCSGVTYAWSGNGISGSTSPLNITAPSTAGTYTYTVTANKTGCSSKTATTQVIITNGGDGGSTTCINLGDQCSGNSSEVRSYTLNMASAGSYPLKLTYRSHEGAGIARIRVNNGTWQAVNVAQTGVSQYVEVDMGTFTLNAGNNSIDLSSGQAYVCFRQLCAIGGSGCTTPAAPTLSASPSTITTSGGSSTLTASGCTGGTINWTDGLGSGSPKTVTPTATKTYMATCTVDGCTSAAASVTVMVNISGGTPVCINLGDQCSGNSSEVRNYSMNVSSAGSYTLKLTYTSHESPPTGRIRINNGSWQNFSISQTSVGQYVEATIGNFSLNSGSNTIDFASGSGYICFRQLCAQPAGSPVMLEVEPADNLQLAKQFIVSPNPNKGIFETNFYLEKGKKAALIISDIQGRMLHQQTIIGQGFHKERINLAGKASGMIIIQLHSDKGVELKKINIAR